LRLATEVPDVDVERVRREAEVVAPHAFEDDRAGEHLPRGGEEELEEGELRARQLDRLAGPANLARPGIELEISEAQHLARAAARPAQERAHAREELLGGEGLGCVV